MTLSHLTRRALCSCALAFIGLTQTAIAQDAPRVKFVTNAGEFVVEVYPDKAPKTVDNFLQYVRDKHYDGTIFHRVIPNFMIQGGGYDAQYKERNTRAPVQHEGRQAFLAGLKNQTGYLAMARTNDPHSATAQFFIKLKASSSTKASRWRISKERLITSRAICLVQMSQQGFVPHFSPLLNRALR